MLIAAATVTGCKDLESADPGGPEGGTMTTQTASKPHTETVHAIGWLPWGPELFERAKKEDKLILLDSGATWCHWCHVMDRVTYEDPEVVALLNEKFIPVRIDRDRLPDVDAHYQRAQAIFRSRGGGWPLTVVITPSGHTLFKATFLPPRAGGQFGASLGLIELLHRVDAAWREHRSEIEESGGKLREAVRAQTEELYERPGEVSQELVEKIVGGIKDAHDPVHGGFGSAPKFFNISSMELLSVRAWAGDEGAHGILIGTLDAIARGGVYDQVGGGFHRYSVDERWHVPHFEKMAYDNAPLLALYANAYAMTGNQDYARITRETIEWVRRMLLAPNGEGFYASQDADVGLDDDGDYFTWTVEEARSALGPDAEALIAYYDIDAPGDMHGRAGRNVLHVPKTVAQHAALSAKDPAALAGIVEQGKARLLAARQKRVAPNVDKTVFADLNGMMIDAFLTAHERLDDRQARDTALFVLNYLLEHLRDDRGVFAHYRQGPELRRAGLLADQAWMARALVHAAVLTGEDKYLREAATLADYVLEHLTTDAGGLLGSPKREGPAAVPPRRGWEDSPTRSAASLMAHVLIDLGYLTGQDRYRVAGNKALRSFAGGVERGSGTFLGGYALAAEHLINGPRTVIVVKPAEKGDAVRFDALVRAARRSYVPGGLVMAVDLSVAEQAALLKRLGYAPQAGAVAYVCRGKSCLAPAFAAEEVIQRLAELSKGL